MDGNGRWATQRGLPRIAGHIEGRQATKRAIVACNDLGVSALSLYTFSTENWNRPADEVSGLMALIEGAFLEELEEMRTSNVNFRASGRLEQLPPTLQRVFEHGRETTAANTGLKLNLCVNYGGRAEIVDAARALVQAARDGDLDPSGLDEAAFQQALYAPELPDVELFLRPGGETRVSNFLLWQIAYAEIVVMDVLWPDFTADHLLDAIRAFNRRDRRFGMVLDSGL
ncbi:MAG: di-trans,poly-cis-decaprenylcistransferase [Armatimonadetes bacterium]|nr:di-trans,poly-cis-decaprenylcistransferase [Armatimonadota bacterium]